MAQTNDAPAEAPEPVIQPLAIEFSSDGLSGPGGDLLRARIDNAQFIAVGEDHGFAEAPALIAAFAAEGDNHGFDTYVIETGPWSADWLRGQLENGGVDGLAAALKGRPLAIPFLNLREEAEVAAKFVDGGGLWGIDQEFIGSSLIHLEWLAERAITPEAVAELRQWAAADRKAFASGDQPSVFMATASEEEWTRLHEIFSSDDEALALIEALKRSQSVYMANFTGRGFDNNVDRVAMIREYFLDQYAEARSKRGEAPRVLLKMGATHIGAATSPMKTFDIGSLLEGLAAAEGRETLRIAYLPMGGTQIGIRPSPEGAFSVRAVKDGEKLAAELRAAGVDMAAVSGGEGHFVIPLEPVRRALGNRGLDAANPMFRFVALGFDFLVTTNAAEAATPLVDR